MKKFAIAFVVGFGVSYLVTAAGGSFLMALGAALGSGFVLAVLDAAREEKWL